MQISWTRLPFRARNQEQFAQQLNEWLGSVFYDLLPEKGYEVREEQIFTAYRMAGALCAGRTLLAEAGPGTGKTFAYLLPAVCYARMRGAPVVIASASGVLQAQLTAPDGDIQTLSRLLDLDIDARIAAEPAGYLCEVKAQSAFMERPTPGFKAMRHWAEQTGTGARTEVPHAADDLWDLFAWEPTLPCDTCRKRGHCHVMAARRQYRAAADLVICNHRLFAADLLSRVERQEDGQLPLLPAYCAAVLDEGHHLPETWQRAQGHHLNRRRLEGTLEIIDRWVDRAGPMKATAQAIRQSRRLLGVVEATAEPGEGKRHLPRTAELLEAAQAMDRALERLQDELVTDQAMSEGLELGEELRSYQARLDEIRSAMGLLLGADGVAWVEGRDLWVVPRVPVSLFGRDRLTAGMPLIFSSATLEPAYQARILQLQSPESSQVGVPFDLAEQALIYQPHTAGDPVAQTLAVLQQSGGRALVLLRSMAEVSRYRQALEPLDLPFPVLWEGDGERGAQLERFRSDHASVLIGASFWEGVDVPGESLSCCIIPGLPFPEHDPLIRERRLQAEEQGADPFMAVDLPEMLMKLKQGAGRLIRTAQDRGVLALLDGSWMGAPWESKVEEALWEDAQRTEDLARVKEFLG